MLNKNDILSAQDLDTKIVEVPRWGEVRIKAMSVADQIAYETSQKDDDNAVILKLVMLSCVDENGIRLFSDEDMPALMQKSAQAICSLFKECIKLNSLTQEAIEDKAKNS